MTAADSLLSPDVRASFLDGLRALSREEGLAPRLDVIRQTVPVLIDGLYGRDGRMDRAGLALLRRMQGVAEPSPGAMLLAPLPWPRLVSR
jgi:hypothetical protein